MLKKTAVGLDAICLTDGLNRNLSCDFLRHGNSLKINMKDLATNRVMLNLFDKGKLVFSGLAILDFEIDKNVLTNRVGKENLQIPVADFEVFRGLARAVNNGGNRSAGSNLLDGIATAFCADAGGEFDLVGHGLLDVT